MTTVWEDLLQAGLKELSTWYYVTNVNLKDYFGAKLSSTALANVTPVKSRKEVDWESVDVSFYQEHKIHTQAKLNPMFCCPEMLNANIDIFPSCSSHSCKQKVTIISGEQSVKCTSCNGLMKPGSCLCTFECIVEFDDVPLNLPLEVLESFLEDVLSTYRNNISSLVEKLLCSEEIDYKYNTRNVITHMALHN